MPVPGQPPAAIALIGMAKSDLQLLAVAEKLGPLVAEAAATLAAEADAQAASAGPGAADARSSAAESSSGNGTAAAATTNGHAGRYGRENKRGTPTSAAVVLPMCWNWAS